MGVFRCSIFDMAEKPINDTIKIAVLHKLLGWSNSESVTGGR